MILAVYYCKKKTRCMSVPLYPDRESNPELSFRRALLYPFNYQGIIRFGNCRINGFG